MGVKCGQQEWEEEETGRECVRERDTHTHSYTHSSLPYVATTGRCFMDSSFRFTKNVYIP